MTDLKLVAPLGAKTAYPPRDRETVRPFRFWNPQTRKLMPWRHYLHKQRAHNGALIEAWNYLHDGEAIEVLDIRYGKRLGTYVKRSNGIDYIPPD